MKRSTRTMKGQVLLMVVVMGLIMSLLLVSVMSTVNRLQKVQGIATSYVAQEEALSSGVDYARYLIAKGKTQGKLSLPQGTVEVIMNMSNIIGDVYEYYDVLIIYTPQSSSLVVWTAELVRDNVTLSSWIVSVEEGGNR